MYNRTCNAFIRLMQDLITVINLHSGRVMCDDLYQTENRAKVKIANYKHGIQHAHALIREYCHMI